MINYVDLYRRIQKYRVTNDADLPWAYQKANPQGRPIHDDWTIPWLPSLIQPWGNIPRIKTAYKVPLPLKQLSGPTVKSWIAYDGKYPLIEGAQTKMDGYWYNDGQGHQGETQVPYVLSDQPVMPGESVFAAFLDGHWVECFRQYQRSIFGKRFLFSQGLRPDTTISVSPDGSIKSDWMCWFPEVSCTWSNA